MISETRYQALRGAAGAKTLHCAKARQGNPKCWLFLSHLFLCLKNRESKGWVRRVPAAAVIPAAQVVIVIIGPKTSVAGLVNA